MPRCGTWLVSIPFKSGKGFAPSITLTPRELTPTRLNPLQVGEGFCTVFEQPNLYDALWKSQSPSSRGRVLHAPLSANTPAPQGLNPLQVGEGFCTFAIKHWGMAVDESQSPSSRGRVLHPCLANPLKTRHLQV